MESGIRETFAYGVRNAEKFSLWKPESGKILLMKSSIGENFACGSRNRGKFCFWNVESGKILLVESGIREKFACGILNPGKVCSWNPESGKSLLVASRILEFGIRNTAQGIRSPTNTPVLTIGIHNLSETDKDWNEVPGIRNPRAWNPESSTILDSLAWGLRRAV